MAQSVRHWIFKLRDMGSSLSIVVVIFCFHFFLLHDKKAAKLVVLRRNFKVSKIDLARWSIDLLLPLRLFVYIGRIPKRGRKERDMRDERKYLNDPACSLCKHSSPLSHAGASYNLDNSRARAYCACSRCGWGLFGRFYSHLSFSLLFLLLFGRRPDIDWNTVSKGR